MSDPSVAALAERVARLEDERAVLATIYAYGSALDYGDRDVFLDCFTPDADYVVDMRLGAEGSFRCHGHDELARLLRGPHPRARRLAQARHREPVRDVHRRRRNGHELLPSRRCHADERPCRRARVRPLHRRARPSRRRQVAHPLPARRGRESVMSLIGRRTSSGRRRRPGRGCPRSTPSSSATPRTTSMSLRR